MAYFGSEVMSVLASEGIRLTNQELQTYIKVCRQAERSPNLYYKTKKDPYQGRRFSVFHTPISDNNERLLTHWLVLSGHENWQTKNKATATKLYVNIVTGEKKFVKIRRPQQTNAATHIIDSIAEETNNKRLHVPVQHYTRYTSAKGTKAYLFQPYRGDQNLLDYIKEGTTGPKKIINMLLSSGDILSKLHERGYIHTDFKPQNLVVSQDKTMLSLVDVEFMMSIAEGERGQKFFRGTKNYQHPGWFADSASRFSWGGAIRYTTKNDVYAFLVMAENLMAVAFSREPNPETRLRMQEVWVKLTKWQKQPMNALPELSTVLSEIRDLTITDRAQLENKQYKKSCYRF